MTEKYLVQARLPWKVPPPAVTQLNGGTHPPSKPNGAVHSGVNTRENGHEDHKQYLTFEIGQAVDPDIYAILPNDWPYNTPSDVEHVVVWSKVSLHIRPSCSITK